MASELDIFNLALDALKQAEMNDPDVESSVGRKVRRQYAQARDALLQAHNWSFARKVQALSAAADPVAVLGWTYAYSKPTDFIAARRVLSDEFWPVNYLLPTMQDHRVTDVIYSNYTPVWLEYTYRPHVTKFPPMFVDALWLALASRLAVALTGDEGRRDRLVGLARSAFTSAATSDANQDDNKHTEYDEVALINARY